MLLSRAKQHTQSPQASATSGAGPHLPFDILMAVMAVSSRSSVTSMSQTCRELYDQSSKYLLLGEVLLRDPYDAVSFVKFMLSASVITGILAVVSICITLGSQTRNAACSVMVIAAVCSIYWIAAVAWLGDEGHDYFDPDSLCLSFRLLTDSDSETPDLDDSVCAIIQKWCNIFIAAFVFGLFDLLLWLVSLVLAICAC